MSEAEANFAGKYRMIAELGRGGMAEVNLAIAAGPAGFNKLVVIKQLRQNLADDGEFLTMFLDEARLAARLNHPNVVHTYEVVAEQGQYFIAMEYLDGQPLQRVIREFGKSGGMPIEMSLRIICDALAGLHYAQELADYDGQPLGVVHRDISPHNIFVTYEGQTKVVDFGIAKAMNSSSETRSGVIKGKISYMSPEQSRSEPLDRRSDLFAVGIILWEAITGQRLWKGLADVTVLQRLMVNQPVPSPLEVKPDADPALVAIAMKALAPLPADRYDTAADMQNDLENALIEMKKRVTGRDVGRALGEKFSAERAEIRTIIDAQIKVQPTVTGEHSRIARLPSMSQTQSQTSQNTPVSQQTPADRVSHPGQSSLRSSLSLLTPAETSEVPVQPSSGRVTPGRLVALVLGAAVIGATSWMAFGHSSAQNAPIANPAPTGKIVLNLRASPPEAKLFLDDTPLPNNPYAGSRVRDTAPHTLRIEAPGRLTKSRSLSFDNDVSIDLELEKSTADAPTADSARVEPAASADHSDRRRPGGRPADPVRPSGGPATKGNDAPAQTATAAPPPTTKKPANVVLDTTTNPWL